MKQILLFFFILLAGCSIKDENAKVIVEEGTETTAVAIEKPVIIEDVVKRIERSGQDKDELAVTDCDTSSVLGYWVGAFEADKEEGVPYFSVDEGFFWNRENKINISIDEVNDSTVIGHSVVAGNDRPFSGTIVKRESNCRFDFEVEEPGDDKYDGKFIFSIYDRKLQGKWTAYQNLEVRKRIYELDKKTFKYQPHITLESGRYIDWYKSKTETETVEYEEGIFEQWAQEYYASSTDKIYKINASERILTEEEVQNLKRGDLVIIRNTIYARHGYSFKHRPLRIFFDAQPWYIPVHTDIRADFTEIERKNIQLLLKYEKNAAEYYDYFGRG
jgi:hypothetical protein